MRRAMRRGRIAAHAVALSVLVASGCDSLPAYPEALVVVDTDLPVPQIAARMRVDLYAEDGTWYLSRDTGLPNKSDWPTSFGVYSTNESADTLVLARIRVYPGGDFVRDYLGERYSNQHGPLPHAAGSGDMGPRLIVDGADVTPTTEPQPLVTVDRLVLLRLQPGIQGRVSVLMSGECAGTMSLLSQTPPYQTPRFDQAATCIDQENNLSFLTPQTVEPDVSVPSTSRNGTFATGEPCQSGASSSQAECVPGGVFIMGDPRVIDMGPAYSGIPERVVGMDRFWIDRNEVTVGALRSALKAGFYRGRTLPIGVHDGKLGVGSGMDAYPLDAWCTWSTSPTGREDYPVSCVDWRFARDYCVFQGGSLTTEAQWEYAASAAGRPFKTNYPWGGSPPSCEEALFDRTSLDGHVAQCGKYTAGPAPVTTTPFDSTPSGILNLAGSQAELMIDNLEAYSAPCWLATIHNPSCVDPSTSLHTLRGGSWALPEGFLFTAWRSDSALQTIRSIYGFRCAYAALVRP